MGRTKKDKGVEKQSIDDASSEANAIGNLMEASSEHATPPSESPTTVDIMTAINWLGQNVNSKFETLHESLADLKQAMADVEKSYFKRERPE